MAATAELVGVQAKPFDWESAEAQFVQHQQVDGATASANYMCPPEDEIYGRSLSTIRRLGACMINATSMEEIIRSPEADQAKIEFYTSVQEGFGTDMELGGGLEVRDFDRRPIINGRVMSKDRKTAISDMTEAGLVCAQETAQKDRRFLPQLTRSVWDHDNALIVDQMARGETDYNMRLVISPFPQEAATQSGDAYWRGIGYVPHLKRGFVQLYCTVGNELLTGSLSFDGSDKERLRDVFGQLGIEVPAGEITDNWLKYAVTGSLPEDEAKVFATEVADMAGNPDFKKNTNTVDVTERHGQIMERAFDESYIHIGESLVRGYQTAGAKALVLQLASNAHNFNDRYAKALYRMRADGSQFTADDSIVLHELLVYSTIEMMRAMHLQERALQQGHTYEGFASAYLSSAALQSADSSSFQNMLGGFGADGARNNRTYSACGNSISLGDNEKDDGPQSAFGGRDKSEDSSEGGACDYVHTGCYCCPYNDDGSSRSKPMKVVARREADGTAHCKRPGCGAWLSADGSNGNIGNIARRAQEMQQRKKGSFALTA